MVDTAGLFLGLSLFITGTDEELFINTGNATYWFTYGHHYVTH